MDLLVRVGIIAAILIAIFGGYLAFKYVAGSGPLTSTQAAQNVQRVYHRHA